MFRGAVVDVDVHHRPSQDADLLPYVPERSRELATRMVVHGVPLEMARAVPVMPLGANRLDTEPPDGSPPGSSYEMLRDQCLDPWPVARCLLTYNVGEYGSHLN